MRRRFRTFTPYKNLIIVFLGILIALLLSRNESFQQFLLHLGTLGYIGAFFAGVLFVNTFTFSIGALILLILAERLSVWELGFIAGLGTVVGDLLIFGFVKNNLVKEINSIYNRIDHDHHLVRLMHTKYFNWSLPLIGALIIASPLPDELGVTLMGIAKMPTYKFIFVSFVLNFLGILLVLSASTFIKP